ncbi:MAG TPA: L-threonylcarbamoyladenylate synthase [Terriglobales bacterium]|nr:L-threonylcarbamoyladenylate synthase [Terriglobales bacterium]
MPLAVDRMHPAPALITELASRLRAGGVMAVPTDTVYGIAADALSDSAVARVYACKGRTFNKPLPVVVRDRAQARSVGRDMPQIFERLADAFWPGPLTLLVAAAPHLPRALTAGTGTIAMRQPDLPLLLALLEACGFPLTATSANRSGEPECLTAAAVAEQFGDALDIIVDGGASTQALPSTIVDLTQPTPRIVRAGAIPANRLADFW